MGCLCLRKAVTCLKRRIPGTISDRILKRRNAVICLKTIIPRPTRTYLGQDIRILNRIPPGRRLSLWTSQLTLAVVWLTTLAAGERWAALGQARAYVSFAFPSPAHALTLSCPHQLSRPLCLLRCLPYICRVLLRLNLHHPHALPFLLQVQSLLLSHLLR